ncbi:EF-hand domain-containing protein [cf. Phormidesmis sp. LEGE 11477]|uniref:EF-hand domain-containing protein n=1 Tax=cf. Phormidesmis sp. LEGE 11477 TaxID=1828680 RepID=UPI00187FAFC2|nr:EF-hand domain-containing protein [cf. Phormidesmis sp. LEGE 11477]MBE9064859.1 EF-hand domain-containing protein [cf. Phormidesmis sp. LEGE 11477]
MLSKVSEKTMRQVRWSLVIGWSVLIGSLFYDPLSSWLTKPTSLASPLRLNVERCVPVQGQCLTEVPYALGAPLFWGIIVPTSIFILLVLGHEVWRRVCPLSFISQIPRALGWERKRKRTHQKTGKIRYELVKVDKKSWLARNHVSLQFGLFFLGLCNRILFVNSNRIALGIFLLGTIAAALTVGFLYGGKAWCQYFCPMAPVQKIYAEPRALLNSTAHLGDRQPISQSMCRTISPEGKELSACVACQSPCIDIDAERTYWDGIQKPQQQWLYYGYVGIAVGYFVYYYLYAGSWNYYFSGAWAHEEAQLANLLKPGFYLFGEAIAIPKLVAVPLTLGAFTLTAYSLGRLAENRYKAYRLRHQRSADTSLIRHQAFTLCTFFIFNFFFIFAGNNFIQLLPGLLPQAFPILIAICSSLWLYRTWQRSPSLYRRESLASRLLKQLKKLDLDVAKALEGRSLDDLSADELYVLAKVLPDFSQEKRLQTYQGVLKETLQDGYVEPANSLKSFAQLRRELDISDADHETILTALSQDYPEIFDPRKTHSQENSLRLESYRESLLETILSAWKDHPAQVSVAELMAAFSEEASPEAIATILDNLSQRDRALVTNIRQEYSITADDEADALHQSDPHQLWHTIAERISLLDHLKTGGDNQLRKIFAQIDADSSGHISLTELREYIQAIEPNFTTEQIKTMLQRADTSGDEQVSYEEFQLVIQGLS